MKLEKFAALVKDESVDHEAQRTAEQRRKVFHALWLDVIYPHWQGPASSLTRHAGIESVTHVGAPGFAAAANANEILTDIAAGQGRTLEWLITETIAINTKHGVTLNVCYVFSGDENDGVMARLISVLDKDVTIDPSYVRIWNGPLGMLGDAAIDDVASVMAKADAILAGAITAHRVRLAEEKRQAEEAERQRLAAIAKAKADEEERRRQMEQAALEESRRLEAKKAAAEEAEDDDDETPAPQADPVE